MSEISETGNVLAVLLNNIVLENKKEFSKLEQNSKIKQLLKKIKSKRKGNNEI